MHYTDIIDLLDEIPNDDENISKLEKAMMFFCSNYDICEGYKHAIIETLKDQYEHHESEQDPKDLDKLSDILNGAI